MLIDDRPRLLTEDGLACYRGQARVLIEDMSACYRRQARVFTEDMPACSQRTGPRVQRGQARVLYRGGKSHMLIEPAIVLMNEMPAC